LICTTIKPRPCKQCGSVFTPPRPLAYICSPGCASKYVKAVKKADKAQTKARKEAIKTRADWHADAQKAVNAMVRARDAGEPCISCNAPWEPTFQAGHYRSRGAAKNLALDPRNIAAQCVQCNLHRHGNAIDFRLGLIGRYGVEFVEAIEADNEPRHHSIDDLRAIRAEHIAMVKQLKKEMA
jgi:hypothetical protein